MPQERIPFVPNQESGAETLAGASPEAHNVVIDRRGAVRRRPGIATDTTLATTTIDANGIDGLHATAGGKLLAVSAASRTLYEVGPNAAVNLSNTSGASLAGGARPVFAETEGLVAIASGNAPHRLVLDSGDMAALGGSPPDCTHIVANAGRLLVNQPVGDFPGRISYSSTAFGSTTTGHEEWSLGTGTAGFFTAEARPDRVLALHESTNELFAFGASTLQVFAPDAQSVYAPLPTKEYGCMAAYSVVKRDQAFAWLDDRRRFVLSDGRSFEVLSSPIQQTLDDMSTVSDCFGYRVHHGPVDCLVWTFPTDGRTFAYQFEAGWSQWSGWDNATGNFKPFTVTAHHQRADTGLNLVGTSAGRVAALKASAQDDLGDPIVARVDTGFLDRGTDRRKQCVSLRLVLERTEPSGSDEPVVHVSWRDDLGPWGAPRAVSLGSSGYRVVVGQLRSLGVYRRRQWRFTFSGSETLVLASATEEFEVLEV